MTNYYKILIICVAALLCSCNAQHKILYLQDIANGDEITLPEEYQIRLKPHDQITVVVNSDKPELAAPFNSATNYNALNGTQVTGSYGENSLQVITIDSNGYIEFPILGKIKCSGLTREQLAADIQQRIIKGGYIDNPTVNIRFANLTISILGEVNKPGRYSIVNDRITIFEALALAGDLTIYGDREQVSVIRTENGKSIVTKLDLRSKDIFDSSCYYLEQNDVVLVSPNKYKAATSEINQNRTFWISIASTFVSVATLVVTIISIK
jgi:polysaccharide export outer membrane protein